MSGIADRLKCEWHDLLAHDLCPIFHENLASTVSHNVVVLEVSVPGLYRFQKASGMMSHLRYLLALTPHNVV